MTSLRIINVPSGYDGHDVRNLFARIGTVVSVQDVAANDVRRRHRTMRVTLAEDGVAARAVATLHGSRHGDRFLIVRDDTRAPAMPCAHDVNQRCHRRYPLPEGDAFAVRDSATRSIRT